MAVQKSKNYQTTSEYKKSVVDGQKQWRDSLHGPEVEHKKICELCEREDLLKLFKSFVILLDKYIYINHIPYIAYISGVIACQRAS